MLTAIPTIAPFPRDDGIGDEELDGELHHKGKR